MQRAERRIIILGSTGSIGVQTLAVIEHLNALHDAGRFGIRHRVVGLAGGRNLELLRAQGERHGVPTLALAAGPRADPENGLRWVGNDAAATLVREVECDMVVAAMVGSRGVPATLAAVQLGRDVALANKESLVAAGRLVIPAARQSGSRLLPVDSEHSGVWQCLASSASGPAGQAPPLIAGADVARITLTASGGPFRTWPVEAMRQATPQQALNHPTWRMGAKVTIDSATLMNKALELIEAKWLFGLDAGRLAAVIHPQSLVHSLVEYVDGSVIAQIAAPDMRLPIQLALTHPARPPGLGAGAPIGRGAPQSLEFEPIDTTRFPAMRLVEQALGDDPDSAAAAVILNAANEVAVERFLAGDLSLDGMTTLLERALETQARPPITCIDDVLELERRIRGWSAGAGTHC